MVHSAPAPPDQPHVEAAIREVERAYDAAWQAGDLEGLLACLTSDAVLINPFGGVAVGHDEIRRELAGVLSGPAAPRRHTSVITRVTLVTDGVAVVDGEVVLEGTHGQAPFTHRFTDVLVKRTGGWRVAHIRAYQHLEHPR